MKLTEEEDQRFKDWWEIQSEGVAITYKGVIQEYAYAAWAKQQQHINNLLVKE